jgi:4-hydroxythreonine-4-phosphate dehydrogenase
MGGGDRPIIGITMGDPAGIGPEVVVKALSEEAIYKESRPLVIGDTKVLKAHSKDRKIYFNPIKEVEEGRFLAGWVDVLDLQNIRLKNFKVGKVSIEAGRASVEYIKEATKLALGGKIHAIVTAPICKEAINKAGFLYEGHTEFFADLTKANNYAMFFVSPSIKVALVTVHIPLKDVPKEINSHKVLKVIKLLHNALLKFFAIKEPRIGVAALNPHGGEGGIFGKEERKIKEAVEEAKRMRIRVEGPYPADTLFRKENIHRYDAFIAMYHDQALIPVKLLGFERAVNVTLGLPFPRTSVAHGTAFDIAGKGLANPSSMKEAIRLATKMVKG